MSLRIPFLCKKNLFSSYYSLCLILGIIRPFLTVVLYTSQPPCFELQYYFHFPVSYKKEHIKRNSLFLLTHPPWFCLYSLIQVGQTCFHVLCISSFSPNTLVHFKKESCYQLSSNHLLHSIIVD